MDKLVKDKPVKIGLEIHQQLNTHKLFCACPSELTEEVGAHFIRYLSPTKSELGTVDRAALSEAGKNLIIHYESGNTCLVEADEEPPHPVNEEAVEIAVRIGKTFQMEFMDELYFMRKIVIDGSNTTGFQRTGLVAKHGRLQTSKGEVRIDLLCLEEDSARKISEKGEERVYRLDRLGIPLVEVTTAPDIVSGEHAMETAALIGAYLRATGQVKRGLGTIRQDLNISIPGGARVELKGVQDLRGIPEVVEVEVNRQARLLEVKEALRALGITEVKSDIYDLSRIFEKTGARLIKKGMKNGRVYGIVLKGFAGLIGSKYCHTFAKTAEEKKEEETAPRLGRELSGYAKKAAGIGGIFHSDELPAYGITAQEVEEVHSALGTAPEDAFVLVVADRKRAEKGLNAVIERAEMAIQGVPEEVRRVRPDNTSEFMRPMPGAARMYPETDVPPVRFSHEFIRAISVPELPEHRVERYTQDYGLSMQQARQLISEGQDWSFEAIVSALPGERRENARLTASVLLNTLPELRREGLDVGALGTDEIIGAILEFIKGTYSKEAIPEVLREMAISNRPAGEAASALGLVSLSREVVEEVIRRVVNERREFILKRGNAALGPLMGVVMKELRGKAGGKTVNALLAREVQRLLKEQES